MVIGSHNSWARRDVRQLPAPVCTTSPKDFLDHPGRPVERSGAYPIGSPAGNGKRQRRVFVGRRLTHA